MRIVVVGAGAVGGVVAANLALVVSAEDDLVRRGDALKVQPVGNEPHRSGGSSWQSLQRGTESIETDQLTGEIVLPGRLHAVPTPANPALQEIAAHMALAGEPPSSRSEADVLESLRAT